VIRSECHWPRDAPSRLHPSAKGAKIGKRGGEFVYIEIPAFNLSEAEGGFGFFEFISSGRRVRLEPPLSTHATFPAVEHFSPPTMLTPSRSAICSREEENSPGAFPARPPRSSLEIHQQVKSSRPRETSSSPGRAACVRGSQGFPPALSLALTGPRDSHASERAGAEG